MDMRRARPGISPLLLLSALLHLIFWYFLPAFKNLSPDTQKQPSMMVRIIPPSEPPAPPSAKAVAEVAASVPVTALAASRPKVAAPIAQARTAVAVKSITVESDTPPITVQPEASPQPAAVPNLAERAKKALGQVDTELWAELPAAARSARLGKSAPLPLEKSIAAAAKPRTGSMETVYGTDGQQFTKYHGPLGTYCIWVPKVPSAATAGTPFENASRVTTCPS